MNTHTGTAGHGLNFGYGFVKVVVIDEHGAELPPVVFPSQIARAGRTVAGALATVDSIDVAGRRWWVGDDAGLSASAQTMLGQDRLTDPAFIPALVLKAQAQLGDLNGASSGYAVTGLPASWAADRQLCQQLVARIRSVSQAYPKIRVIPEILGPIYALTLDNNGGLIGNTELHSGRVAVVDWGTFTVNEGVVHGMVPQESTFRSHQLGMSKPLAELQARLGAHYDCDLSMHQVDQAVRARGLLVGGKVAELPKGWDRPFLDNAELVVSRLRTSYGKGAGLAGMVLGGGGFEVEIAADRVRTQFPFAAVVPEPQLAIARAYARLARRFALGVA